MVPDDARRRAVARGRLPRRGVRAHRLAADLRRRARGDRRRAAQVRERARRAPRRRRPALPGVVAPAARRASARSASPGRCSIPRGSRSRSSAGRTASRSPWRCRSPAATSSPRSGPRRSGARGCTSSTPTSPQNATDDRAITARLYGGDLETRIQQELVLGIGGLRALARCGRRPERPAPQRGPHRVRGAPADRSGGAPIGRPLRRRAAHRCRADGLHDAHPGERRARLLPPELAGPYLAPYAELLGIGLEELLTPRPLPARGPNATRSARRCSRCGSATRATA